MTCKPQRKFTSSPLTEDRDCGADDLALPCLAGIRILLFEDDYFLGFDLRAELVRCGAEIIGPYGSYDLALDLAKSARRIDAAIVDIDLHGEFTFPIMDMLISRDVPAVYWTGFDRQVVPYRHQHIPRFEKPVANREVARGIAALLAEHGASRR